MQTIGFPQGEPQYHLVPTSHKPRTGRAMFDRKLFNVWRIPSHTLQGVKKME